MSMMSIIAWNIGIQCSHVRSLCKSLHFMFIMCTFMWLFLVSKNWYRWLLSLPAAASITALEARLWSCAQDQLLYFNTCIF